jgi:short-subunit dehydrogenase
MKRIIIIGATSGIGKALAALYAEKGHRVGITGRREELLTGLQKKFPQNIFTACFDVTGSENTRHLQELIAALGGLDLFIYNAGFGEPSDTLDIDMELSTTLTNVLGCVELAGYAFNYFLGQGYGQIALTSSVAALRGNSFAPAYSASKAFVSNYAEGLNMKAWKLGKKIVVTDIRPGFVDTKKAKGHGRFWVATPQKAALQIMEAIAKKRRVAYITKRWWLIAQLMNLLPFSLLRRLA